MKRSTASWTTAIAASALLAMPVGSWAQQPAPTPSQTSRPSGAQMDQQGSANEHLRQAGAALNDIPAASLTGTTKTKVAELKRYIATLERSASSSPAAGKTSAAPAGKANWSTDVAAADRILTELLGAQGTTGATEPGMTGTTGSTSTKPGARSSTATSTSATLDEAARTKLQEVRTHLTAFAASMSGTGSAPGAASTSSDDPSSPASASAAATPSASPSPSAASSPASATPSASPASPSAASPTPSAAPSSTTAPAAAPSDPSAAQPPPQAQAAQPASPAQSVDTENVKRHLSAARDSLSQMTQLPAAAQLTGDARTQVSQLISNFNELITTNTNWKASYDKLQANLTALVGDQRADESPATPAAGAAGAVGTSGTTAIDPGIRAKLVEFRTHLMDFEKAASGGASASPSSPAAEPSASAATPAADPAAAAASTAAPASTTAPAAPAASPSPAATPEPSPAATPEPTPTGTSGRSSSTPSAAGTSGTTAAPAASATASAEPQERPSPAAQSSAHKGMSSDAMRHIEAIEAILNGSGSATAGTSGSSASKTAKSSVSSLDRAQIEEIRTHLTALRKALNESK